MRKTLLLLCLLAAGCAVSIGVSNSPAAPDSCALKPGSPACP